MVTAEIPKEINVDISGLLETADKTLYTQQLQLAVVCILLGLVIVLVMIGGMRK